MQVLKRKYVCRSNAGVLFASIPNFTEFYSEDVNEGVGCIIAIVIVIVIVLIIIVVMVIITIIIIVMIIVTRSSASGC